MILQMVQESVCNPGFLDYIGVASVSLAVVLIYDYMTELRGDQE